MTFPEEATVKDTREDALNLIDQHDITLDELWVRYYAIGGHAGPFELEAFLHRAYDLHPMDQDLLAIALAEVTTD